MVNQEYTHLAVIADRSGSMSSIKNDMNGGLETFLADQAKEPGTLKVDITVFDHEVQNLFEDVSVSEVEHPVIWPRGSTSLLDALGGTVERLGRKFAALDEDKRPGKVIVLVITDGGENSSTEYTNDVVKTLVKNQTDEFKWEFIFLGANIDSFHVAGNLGFAKGSTINYTANAGGVDSVLRAASAYVTTTRSGLSTSFSEEDRTQANLK
jgi:uncharacterized protein YegL